MRVYPTKLSPRSARAAAARKQAKEPLAAVAPARRAVLRWSWSIAIEIMSVTEALAEADLIVKEMVAISLKWLEGAGTTTFFVRVALG